ncbi:hypothetical protein HDU98_008042 [Podochytrium sp. JEL0797]|nr:hypothetical protein HDU98_008042 [Podochytrium sp. JEL0797]
MNQFASTLAGGSQTAPSAEDDQVALREYEVGCLDYSFLPKCKDVRELANLLNVLRSGREGSYPDLERAFEQRITELDPKHIFSWKKNQPQAAPASQTVDEAILDLQSWADSIRQTDASLRSASEPTLRKKDSAISVRGSAAPTAPETTTKPDPIETVDHHSSGSESSCSSSDSESDASPTSGDASSPKPRSILKSTGSPTSSTDSTKRHVRFQDEVEKANRELERIRRKQEKRAKQIEMHLLQAEGGHKKAGGSSHKKNKKKSGAVSPKQTQQEFVAAAPARHSGGMVIQEVESLEDEVKELAALSDSVPAPVAVPTVSTAPVAVPTVSTAVDSPGASAKKSIKSYDYYSSWDKFDVEKECEKLEAATPAAGTTRINPSKEPEHASVPSMDATKVHEVAQDKVLASHLAMSEKMKGNEAFKAKEFQDALRYYTRSLQISQQVPVYNNRALVHLKLEQYEKAESDATSAIQLASKSTTPSITPTDLFKSHLRRALARSKRGLYLPALTDLSTALDILPGNAEAVALQKEVERKFADVEGENADCVVKRYNGGSGNVVVEQEEEEEEEEDVEAEIVTPFGASCGGVVVQPKRTKDVKGKGRATVAVDDAAPATQEEYISMMVESEQKRREAMMEVIQERREEEARKKQGYACASRGSGGGEVGVTCGRFVDAGVKGKIEITEVDFDSDEEEGSGGEECDGDVVGQVKVEEEECQESTVGEDKDVNEVEVAGKSENRIEEEVSVAEVAEALPPAPSAVESTIIFPPPTTSYEFEGHWKSLQSSPNQWAKYVGTIPAAAFPKILANVGNPEIVVDVFRGLTGLVAGSFLDVCG